MSLIEIKDLNVLIDSKPFFDQPVKNKPEANEKIVEISRHNGYTTGNFIRLLILPELLNSLV